MGFRYFAQSHGRRLGLEGYVRNRYDGAVEVEAEGSAEARLTQLARAALSRLPK